MAKQIVEYDFSILKGLIVARVGTMKEYATKIGRTPQFVSMVFNGKAHFTTKDIISSIPILDISLEQIGELFFKAKTNK